MAQVVGPAMLYLPGSQRFRVILRMGVFVFSLYCLVVSLRSGRGTKNHPSWSMLLLATVYMSFMIFHPTTNTYLAGMGQVGLHLAIVAPLFWAPSYFQGDAKRLSRILTILWVLNGASAIVGILQVRDPDRWLPSEFSSVATNNKFGLAMYQFRDDNGRTMLRPPGLGDMPGAACGAGMFVASMGLAYLGLPVSKFLKLAGVAMAMAGLSVIFLTQVRSALLVTAGSVIVYLITLILQKRMGSALLLSVAIVICGVGSLQYASSLGGRSTIERFASLLKDDPATVYKDSARLTSLTYTLDTLLFDHPLGAGLGRWGMMRNYFGDESAADSPSLWAEIQFAAWVLDGGIVLAALYTIALVVAIRRLLAASLNRSDSQASSWASVVIMLSAGPIALLFSYSPFYSQMGMQFWLLVGAFEGVMQGQQTLRQANTARPGWTMPRSRTSTPSLGPRDEAGWNRPILRDI